MPSVYVEVHDNESKFAHHYLLNTFVDGLIHYDGL
jgi:hypothetical protein